MTYLISCNFMKPSREYDELHGKIKSLGSCTSISESAWVVNCDLATANEVFERIKPSLGNDDQIFVVQTDLTNIIRRMM